ncbi:MAG: hypothetical protein BMS9Abin36_0841 [Gammaproteobacteria bacterium]|nr:MAG: hypothetical protein BMS9Abin36_0841 [Gammaproteobacteria bacterium]
MSFVHHYDHIQFYDANDYVLGIIINAIKQQKDVNISLDPLGSVFVMASKGVYVSWVQENEKFFTTPVGSFNVKTLKTSASGDSGSRKNRRPLDELVWQAAFYASNGCLLKGGCEPIDVVELKRWPNLTRLPHSENAMSIAALLSQYPTSLVLVSRMLDVEIEEVCSFYSAARASGIAQAINRPAVSEEDMSRPHHHRGLLAKLFAKASNL